MTPAEFEPTIPASERLQTPALDRAATGIGKHIMLFIIIIIIINLLLKQLRIVLQKVIVAQLIKIFSPFTNEFVIDKNKRAT